MLALAAAIVFQTPTALPENPSGDYSGIPQLSGGNVTFVGHNVTLELYKDYVMVSSTSEIHNDGGAGSLSFSIPRGRLGAANSGQPAFAVTATWANAPVVLTNGSSSTSDVGKTTVFMNSLRGMGAMKAGGSYALRVNYRLALGKAGFDRKQLLAAYDLSSPMPIHTLNVTYRYAPRVVFRLPEPKPANLGWQIGDRGAFVRLSDYQGNAGLSFMTPYPGGFGNIGG